MTGLGCTERAAERMQPTALRAAAGPLRAAARALLLAFAALAAVACGTTRVTPPPAEAPAAGPYRFGAGDQLAVRVWKNPELSVEVPVRPDGMISVPLLNDVTAEGVTADELRDAIAAKLAEYITAPNVTVILLQSAKRVHVEGEVVRPGPISLATQLTVVDAIAVAGGLSIFADADDIRIIRRGANNEELEFRFDHGAYVRGRAPGTNLVLQPGDLIVVPK